MKILFKGSVFNPTGIATANREIVKELAKKVSVQVTDPWNSRWDFNEGLEHLNNAIDVAKGDVVTIFADYPQFWQGGYGRIIGHFLHEGTKLFPGWVEALNKVEKIFVPSQATKNLFKWNGVTVPIEVIPYGVNSEIYHPSKEEKLDDFVFLSVNSWTGKQLDRKGTGLLIKAFNEEFKQDEKVKLVLKISTFWKQPEDWMQCIMEITGKPNPNILFNDSYLPESEIAKHYQMADCFVAPTMGESFGLTILNAAASGLPIIVTKDKNSGHMDYCRDLDSVLWIDAPTVIQGDPQFFCEGNMQALPDLESLKKQMRYAFEHREELRKKALKNSEKIRQEYSWEKTASKILEFVDGNSRN